MKEIILKLLKENKDDVILIAVAVLAIFSISINSSILNSIADISETILSYTGSTIIN
jgi:hypothetical protein